MIHPNATENIFYLRYYNCFLTEINAIKKFHLWIDVTQLVPSKKTANGMQTTQIFSVEDIYSHLIQMYMSFRPRVWLDKNKTQFPTTDDILSFRFILFCFV